MTDHPVIGISSYQQQARWGSWDDQAILLPRRYVDKVTQAGGLPVLLPPAEGGAELLPRLDGLVLSGGSDVDPRQYGAAAHPAAGPFYPDRDNAELELCRHALASGLPVLGICRGLQVINVALGGTLHQHLPDLVGNNSHSPEAAGYGTHKVSVVPGTQLAAILGRSEAAVPTHHHQAIDRLGAGLVATAWTDDGVIEAVEFDRTPANGHAPGPASHARPPFMIAVPWHPEAGDDLSLFTALVAAASDASLSPTDQIRLGTRAPAAVAPVPNQTNRAF
jgi:putative glutamine amidotransferase